MPTVLGAEDAASEREHCCYIFFVESEFLRFSRQRPLLIKEVGTYTHIFFVTQVPSGSLYVTHCGSLPSGQVLSPKSSSARTSRFAGELATPMGAPDQLCFWNTDAKSFANSAVGCFFFIYLSPLSPHSVRAICNCRVPINSFAAPRSAISIVPGFEVSSRVISTLIEDTLVVFGWDGS